MLFHHCPKLYYMLLHRFFARFDKRLVAERLSMRISPGLGFTNPVLPDVVG
jgi:hypothetical protein